MCFPAGRQPGAHPGTHIRGHTFGDTRLGTHRQPGPPTPCALLLPGRAASSGQGDGMTTSLGVPVRLFKPSVHHARGSCSASLQPRHPRHHLLPMPRGSPAPGAPQDPLQPLTCKHEPHERVPDEGAVDNVPKPPEVGQDEVVEGRTGLQHVVEARPELGWGRQTRQTAHPANEAC